MKSLVTLAAFFTLTALPAFAMDQAEEHTRHVHHVPIEEERVYDLSVTEKEPTVEPVPEGAKRLTNRSIKIEAEVMSAALLKAKKENEIVFRLSHNGTPLTAEELEVVHTRKVHALIIDPTLVDYQHVHPEPTDTPGEYRVNFTPKTDRSYLMWLDLKPAEAPQAYLKLSLPGVNQSKAKIDKSATREASVGGYTFTLTFDDENVVAGTPAMGHVTVSDPDGKPVETLEPVMGAFAHIVGFYEDRKGIAHMHPMGAEPADDEARGGPVLDFHFEPNRKGFVKLFAQVKIDGKELFAPFGLEVK